MSVNPVSPLRLTRRCVMPDPAYDQRVVWILRQNGIGPFQLKEQYAAYKDKRAAFEAGYGTADDVAVLVTPGVAAMLDLEDQMLADFTAEQKMATPIQSHWATLDTLFAATWLAVGIALFLVWVLSGA